jgi:hypothetical protein
MWWRQCGSSAVRSVVSIQIAMRSRRVHVPGCPVFWTRANDPVSGHSQCDRVDHVDPGGQSPGASPQTSVVTGAPFYRRSGTFAPYGRENRVGETAAAGGVHGCRRRLLAPLDPRGELPRRAAVPTHAVDVSVRGGAAGMPNRASRRRARVTTRCTSVSVGGVAGCPVPGVPPLRRADARVRPDALRRLRVRTLVAILVQGPGLLPVLRQAAHGSARGAPSRARCAARRCGSPMGAAVPHRLPYHVAYDHRLSWRARRLRARSGRHIAEVRRSGSARARPAW